MLLWVFMKKKEAPNSISIELANFLLAQREQIVDSALGFGARHWADSLLVKQGKEYRTRGCIAGLDNLHSLLTSGVLPDSSGEWIHNFASHFAAYGVSLKQSVDIWLSMKEIIASMLWRAYSSEPEKLQMMLSMFDWAMRTLVAHLSQKFEEEVIRLLNDEHVQEAIWEERQRFSREVHDNLLQALGLVKLKSSMAIEFLSAHRLEQVETSLNEIHDIASEAYTDAREAIFGLRSIGMENQGFLLVLQEYLIHYKASFGIDVKLYLDDKLDISLTPSVYTQVMYIIQEALSNIRKHANDSKIWIQIASTKKIVRIVVKDDGQGFDLQTPRVSNINGVGLTVMKERVESIGGKIKVESKPGQGTFVTIQIPQVYNPQEDLNAVTHSLGG